MLNDLSLAVLVYFIMWAVNFVLFYAALWFYFKSYSPSPRKLITFSAAITTILLFSGVMPKFFSMSIWLFILVFAVNVMLSRYIIQTYRTIHSQPPLNSSILNFSALSGTIIAMLLVLFSIHTPHQVWERFLGILN